MANIAIARILNYVVVPTYLVYMEHHIRALLGDVAFGDIGVQKLGAGALLSGRGMGISS
eukprot:CAMPEP_0184694296 /NCGR_PEP_ID=MMETSP0313-20130426/2313_1 /TAXON_ID=2792 /ORGANISM="Porphyridium aerugineum, Strain SAG 1380-2" /LENGTH=58 /DNA_ID=CAMNT_0027152571 /DNA_START=85 /DNA_END=259 /DNA_ORIENTATION=-